MWILLWATAFIGQIDHVELKGLQFNIESRQILQINQKNQKKRILFDIKPAKLGPKVPHSIIPKNKGIYKIRIAQHSKNTVRVLVETKGNLKLSMRQLTRKTPSQKPAPALPQALLKAEETPDAIEIPKKPLRIVIDPGHGGDDPGAIGKKGLREKDVTLALAKRVKALIEKSIPSTQIFLTREEDKTLSLPSRTDFANRMKADLFISIHVNASPNRGTQGIETYYLNISHDRYALRLAARENAMSETETSNLEFILADLAMKSSVSDSVRLGHLVQETLCKHLTIQWNDIRNLGLKHALFYVLMGAKMPAILVETSFISNKMDEKRLKDSDYQHALAEGIVKGIQRYSEETLAMR